MKAYVERYADGLISELFGSAPAISVLGPRACGKTTTAKRHTDGLWSLDTPSEASAFRLDPDLALTSRPEPLLIDEWQEVPEALGALKRSVDSNPLPRRFMLTGSIRAETETNVWPGTGRLINVAMGPLTQRELAGKASSPLFLDTLRKSATLEDFLENTSKQNLKEAKEYGLADYLSLSEVGGFPTPAFSDSNRVVQHWYESYLEQVATRDALSQTRIRNPEALTQLLGAIAIHSAGLPSRKTLALSMQTDERTTASYLEVLSNLRLLTTLPAWRTNRLKRLTSTPKISFCDPALIFSALRLDQTGVLSDADLVGRIIETFVISQLSAEAPFCTTRPKLFHLRDSDGHEIDLIAEYGGGIITGIEVKASSTPSLKHAKSLLWAQQRLGDRFDKGIILHTGEAIGELAPNIWALPISTIWN